MHIALTDKTNNKTKNMTKKSGINTEKGLVITFLKEREQIIKDFNYRNNLIKCVEILWKNEPEIYGFESSVG